MIRLAIGFITMLVAVEMEPLVPMIMTGAGGALLAASAIPSVNRRYNDGRD